MRVKIHQLHFYNINIFIQIHYGSPGPITIFFNHQYIQIKSLCGDEIGKIQFLAILLNIFLSLKFYCEFFDMILQKLPNKYFAQISEFQFTDEISYGSQGSVIKAIHKMTKKVYAIKMIEMNPKNKEALERQIFIHENLKHPHIVTLWDFLESQSKMYLVLDFIENGSLFNFQKKLNNFTEAQSFHIFYQVLSALEFLHANNIYHRDLKPENILLDNNFNVFLSDFGEAIEDLTKKRNSFCGTYEYMAPQMLDGKPYDYHIDIWSLGILLYELNHGCAPFEGREISDIKCKIKIGFYQIKQSLSRELKELIIRILQFHPEKRLTIKEIKQSKWVQKNIQHTHQPFRIQSYSEVQERPNTKKSMKQIKKNRTEVENRLKDFNKEEKSSKRIERGSSGKSSKKLLSKYLKTEPCEFFNKNQIKASSKNQRMFRKDGKKKNIVRI